VSSILEKDMEGKGREKEEGPEKAERTVTKR